MKINRSPLIFGGDPRKLDTPTIALLTNDEVLEVAFPPPLSSPFFCLYFFLLTFSSFSAFFANSCYQIQKSSSGNSVISGTELHYFVSSLIPRLPPFSCSPSYGLFDYIIRHNKQRERMGLYMLPFSTLKV